MRVTPGKPGTYHEQKVVKLMGRRVSVDRAMAGLLVCLNNDLGMETLYSCQGFLQPKRSQGPEANKAYISFNRQKDALLFFGIIFDVVAMVQVEPQYPHGRAVVRFYSHDLRRVVRRVKDHVRKLG